MKKQKNNKSLTLAVAFVLGCCVFGTPSEAFAQEAKAELAFDLDGITVEAARPDWETKLSPGSVTVIRPDDYKGEQKTLPDLMRKVPGVHVREVNGKGQYTTVTVRGSTAAQVGVFVDGVLSNLGGDSAVDLSTIPVANVERIEVYRGYIPARFAGTFIGGVINIVTKKPDKTNVSVELGKSSYGGKKGATEITAPLGDGSLMFGWNYESSDGDFSYDNYAAASAIPEITKQINQYHANMNNFKVNSFNNYKGVLGHGGTDIENFKFDGKTGIDAWDAYVADTGNGFAKEYNSYLSANVSKMSYEELVKAMPKEFEQDAVKEAEWKQKVNDYYYATAADKTTDAYKANEAYLVGEVANSAANQVIPENNADYLATKKNKEDYEKKLKQAQNAKRWRKYNDYENINSILKWQNDEWMVKAAWNKIDRHLPDGLWNGSFSDGLASWPVDLYDTYYYDSRRQKIDTKELLLQNRQNVGDLEWGWMVDYTKSDKEYRAEHIMENDVTNFETENTPLREWSRYESDKYNAQIDGSYKISNNNMLDFQVNFSREKLNVNGSNMEDRKINDGNITDIYGQIRDEYEQEMINVQIQDTITLDDKDSWFLTPSVKYNRSTITGYSNRADFSNVQDKLYGWITPEDEQTDDKFTWQLALKKQFDDNFTMRMTGGTYYRLLNMYEIAGDGAGILPAPNESGRESSFPYPEEGKQFDISALWHGKTLGSYNKTSLTYFWRDSDNMLQLQRIGKDYWSYMNDNRGTARGVEIQSNFNWNKFDLDLQATYTRMRTQSKKDGSYGFTDTWPTFQPEWEGNVRFTYRPESNVDIFAEAHYTDMYYTYRVKDDNSAYPSGLPTDDLLVFNTGIKWKIKDKWQLAVGCNDVFNKGPEQKIKMANGTYLNPEFPVQGRTYYATLKCDF